MAWSVSRLNVLGHMHIQMCPYAHVGAKRVEEDNQLIPGVFRVAASAVGGALSIARAVAYILQESQMDENELAERLKIMKTHIRTIQYTIDNSPTALKRWACILGGA